MNKVYFINLKTNENYLYLSTFEENTVNVMDYILNNLKIDLDNLYVVFNGDKAVPFLALCEELNIHKYRMI